MSNIVRLAVPSVATNQSPYERFCEARGAMLRAYASWLATQPGNEELRDETEGTASALGQMKQLLGAHDA